MWKAPVGNAELQSPKEAGGRLTTASALRVLSHSSVQKYKTLRAYNELVLVSISTSVPVQLRNRRNCLEILMTPSSDRDLTATSSDRLASLANDSEDIFSLPTHSNALRMLLSNSRQIVPLFTASSQMPPHRPAKALRFSGRAIAPFIK